MDYAIGKSFTGKTRRIKYFHLGEEEDMNNGKIFRKSKLDIIGK